MGPCEFVEYASCNFQVEWRAAFRLAPSKLLAQNAANSPLDDCRGILPKHFRVESFEQFGHLRTDLLARPRLSHDFCHSTKGNFYSGIK